MTQSEWVKINAQRPELNLVAVPLEWAATESNGGKGGPCKRVELLFQDPKKSGN